MRLFTLRTVFLVLLGLGSAPLVAQTHSADTTQRVYRLMLEDGRYSLEAIQDVRGDFRREREDLRPGMLRVSLLDAANEVRAEKTITAPDHFCVVLDPNVDRLGEGKAAQLTPPGPVVFQVRMPIVEDAAVLNVHRIEPANGPVVDGAVTERLVASIPLDQR